MNEKVLKHLKKYSWLYAVIVLPLLAPAVINPEWAGRLIVVIAYEIGVPVLLILAALNPKTKGFRDNSPMVNKYGEAPNLTVRFTLGAFAAFFFVVSTWGFVKDIPLLISGSVPYTMTGKIIDSERSPTAGGGFLREGIKLGEGELQWSLLVHAPLLGAGPEEYEFLYLPNSHHILEVRDPVTGVRR